MQHFQQLERCTRSHGIGRGTHLCLSCTTMLNNRRGLWWVCSKVVCGVISLTSHAGFTIVHTSSTVESSIIRKTSDH